MLSASVKAGGSMRRAIQFAFVMLALGVFPGIGNVHAEVKTKTVISASVGKDGLVHIRRRDGTDFVAPREKSPVPLTELDNMQVSVEAPVVAQDGRTVGWLVNFPNCCTSYPIPLLLVIYRDGKILRLITSEAGLPVFKWVFLGNGSEVAYVASTVHGDYEPICELRDVGSGRIIETWQGDKSKALPRWAEPFAQYVGDLQEHSPN
jgi:hypothetical protein